MCGIAGVIGRHGPDVRLAIERTQSALRHRGPDDRAAWSSPAGACALAHTRLGVIEVGPAGHQPMTTPDGRLTISFSGEIDNFPQLRKELEGRGRAFRTQSDTEVILRGFEAFGLDVVPRLRGMFAFAVWRAPFLDATVFDVIARIPAAVRLASAKQLLRDAVHELRRGSTGRSAVSSFRSRIGSKASGGRCSPASTGAVQSRPKPGIGRSVYMSSIIGSTG
jgi:hypothetical protein